MPRKRARSREASRPRPSWALGPLPEDAVVLDMAEVIRRLEREDPDRARRLARSIRANEDAARRFMREKVPVLLEYVRRDRAQRLRAAHKGGRAKARRALRRSVANAWLREIEERRQGVTLESAYARVERREGLQPGTVKKAVLRLRARLRASRKK